jgi:hypothetical protein
MKITIFGGSHPKAGDPAYQEAYELGSLLARSGHTILTGGYIGTMEAASQGANEAGGHVIGVTCTAVEEWRGVRANQWVKEERHFETLQERLNELILACDAAIALPGGPGTLAEIAMMWNLMIIEVLPRRPLVLVGAGWQSVIDQFFHEFGTYLPGHHQQLVGFAPDVETAVNFLESNVS